MTLQPKPWNHNEHLNKFGLNVEWIERRGRIEEARLGFLKAPYWLHA